MNAFQVIADSCDAKADGAATLGRGYDGNASSFVLAKSCGGLLSVFKAIMADAGISVNLVII